ncbi:urease accessory protein UreD [Enterobacter hormaechei]
MGGDTLDISVRLDAKSHALITMPGASKFYRSSGPLAQLRQHFYLDQQATLEWLPQDTILFPGAVADAAVRSFTCAPASTAAGVGVCYCLGRPVMQPRPSATARCANRLEVWRGRRRRVLIERLHLSRERSLHAVAGPSVESARCCVYPATEKHCWTAVRALLAPLGELRRARR